MSFVATAIVGSAVIGGVVADKGAKRAARATQAGADASIAESGRQFDIVREDTAGIRGLGDSAIARINRLFGYGSASKPLSYEAWAAQQPPAVAGFRPGGPHGRIPTGETGGPTAEGYDQYVRDYQPTVTPSAPDMSAFFESPDYQFRVGETQKALDRMGSARGRFASGAALREGSRYASNLASGEFASFYDRLAQQAGLGVTGIGQSAAAGAQAASNIGSAAIGAGNARANSYLAGAQGVNNAVVGGVQNWALQRYLAGGSGGAAPSIYATQYAGVNA